VRRGLDYEYGDWVIMAVVSVCYVALLVVRPLERRYCRG
jgi:hypothetical protein